MVALVLSACAETRGQKWRDDAAIHLRIAQQQWSECSADPNCTGDVMFKRRADLVDAQREFDKSNDEVRRESATLQSAVNQAQIPSMRIDTNTSAFHNPYLGY